MILLGWAKLTEHFGSAHGHIDKWITFLQALAPSADRRPAANIYATVFNTDFAEGIDIAEPDQPLGGSARADRDRRPRYRPVAQQAPQRPGDVSRAMAAPSRSPPRP